jgi:hypothetical protein
MYAGLAVFLLFFIAFTPRAMANVWTDQTSYSAGSTVTISGDNADGAGYLCWRGRECRGFGAERLLIAMYRNRR